MVEEQEDADPGEGSRFSIMLENWREVIRALDRGESAGKGIVVDFRALEYMN